MAAILTLGDDRLEQPSDVVDWPDPDLAAEIAQLRETLGDFRRVHGFGRAIAAPQIGIRKRIVQLNLHGNAFAVINPHISWRSDETFLVWDDCLSVPEHVVQVRRNVSITVQYLDESGTQRQWVRLPADLSELMQHEIDHLDGVLMTERAIDPSSIRPISQRQTLTSPQHRYQFQT